MITSFLIDTERSTEYAEEDVYMVECRYNEGEKEIRKIKGVKVLCKKKYKMMMCVRWKESDLLCSLNNSNSSCLNLRSVMRCIYFMKNSGF